MTRDQLSAELSRMAKMQISDITRAVKSGDKAIALNEVSDLALRLNFLADAIAGVPVPAPAVSPARVLDPA
ncbi:hypothetical protein ASF24_13970 [Methylobacterium sp. Leaf86]|uniref:hypothetical protein n=1 Tax=Methylobacterium sp. Leaf86 TaxID=1736242 RepID=UPI0006F5D549|nr:hypothetical protein [Methylobacterium sp. Leaf86]KQO59259.1 hypothetical protein ASF24_13970 [Methylobacterium sp. Leaf86]